MCVCVCVCEYTCPFTFFSVLGKMQQREDDGISLLCLYFPSHAYQYGVSVYFYTVPIFLPKTKHGERRGYVHSHMPPPFTVPSMHICVCVCNAQRAIRRSRPAPPKKENTKNNIYTCPRAPPLQYIDPFVFFLFQFNDVDGMRGERERRKSTTQRTGIMYVYVYITRCGSWSETGMIGRR